MTRLGYLKAFTKSWEHATLAVLTVGIAFASGIPLALVAGATAYVLGWVFIGDSKWFRRKVDAAELAKLSQDEAAAAARVQAERDALLARLPQPQRRRYEQLTDVCRDIEKQLTLAGSDMFPVEKLDGLMWSFLGLLGSETDLSTFIEHEGAEKFAERIAGIEPEIKELENEMSAVEPGSKAYELKMQLVGSRQESLEALRRRHEQFQRASENLELVRSEQDRIVEQLKLLRSDLYASKGIGQVTQRVNDTIDQLSSSGRISAEVAPAIPELPTFKTRRIGYKMRAESLPPELPKR
jgi:hypothetical protein